MTTTYSISGMTCQHCVTSVREEVCEAAGVDSIDIDLASGQMTVTGSGYEDAAIRAAVTEAGYEISARSTSPSACGSALRLSVSSGASGRPGPTR